MVALIYRNSTDLTVYFANAIENSMFLIPVLVKIVVLEDSFRAPALLGVGLLRFCTCYTL